MQPTPRTDTALTQRKRDRDNVVVGSLWMVGLTLVLFWLPLLNGLIGGLVGGYRVGSVGRALTAAILPAVVVALGLWLLLAAFNLGGWGLLAGLGAGLLIVVADLGIFLGAAVGGAWAQAKARRSATV
ncbi:hypothetical protein [Vulgatibacter sp.]|uniref:hypothetical protein n=1 Tax=Vulgatibacter sp. TaxID=1971226 RepID=UPI00356A03B2